MTMQEQHNTPLGVKGELPETAPNPELEYLSPSRVKSYMECPQRYRWTYVERIQKEEKSAPLHAGTSIHKAFEQLSLGVPFAEVQQGVVDYYANLPGDDNLADAYMVLGLLHAYVIYYRDQMHDVSRVEWPVWLPLVNPETGAASTRFGFHVVIDRVVREAAALRILDHKLYSGDIHPGAPRIAKLRIDDQASAYLLAMRELGIDCHEMVFDMIRKPSIRPRKVTLKELAEIVTTGKYNGLAMGAAEVAKVQVFLDHRAKGTEYRETEAMFCARVMATVLGEPEKYFQRHVVVRTADELDDYQAHLWAVQKSIAAARNNDRFSRNTSSCLDPFECDFCSLCFAGRRKLDEGEIPAGYQRRERA